MIGNTDRQLPWNRLQSLPDSSTHPATAVFRFRNFRWGGRDSTAIRAARPSEYLDHFSRLRVNLNRHQFKRQGRFDRLGMASSPKAAVFGILLFAGYLAFVSGCSRVVLDERFYDTRLGHWTVIDDPNTVEGPSIWKVESDGWVHQLSNIWGRRGDFVGRWYGTYMVAGDADWQNYEYTVKARPGDDDGFGVVFRVRDSSHFYRLFFVQDAFNGGPLTRLDKRNGPDYTEIWSIRKGYTVGAQMRIVVQVDGDHITGSVDGTQVLDVTDGSYRHGKVGLFCYAQEGQAFDDVKVVLK